MNRIFLATALLGLALSNCQRTPTQVSQGADGKSNTMAASRTQQANPRRANPRRVEILFLGDNGHHRPAERVPEIMAALGDKGINFTYTDQLADLNAENLAKYDGLLIYANWDSIPKPQEQAMLDYVAAGHGIIPVHCASFCFRNSPEYVDKVVGGQFWRHRMDTIQTRTVQPNDPIMAGLPTIRAFDETYLHSHLQPDNNVLAVRGVKADQAKDLAAAGRPDKTEEPYTWTRTYGKGRMFYTAYGHDERTWKQPGFQQLLERGILWAVGDAVKKLHDDLKPQAFTYREANLPNYEKRPGAQMEQLPLSPEESMKHLQVPVDFSLSLFAHEPNVMHPIAMTWDDRGRLYVLITKDYPNERKAEGGSDLIVICEDTDKDGKADKFTNYAEGLSIPTGLVWANGGLIVSQAPHMLFLRDTNGDDKADEKKVLFSGFGTFDTHAGPSNLHYGFDNWIWGSVGYSGFKGKGTADKDSSQFGQALFRFRPDGSKIEFMTGTSNNTWGMGFNETGDVFGSTANNSHGWYMAIPNRNYNARPGSIAGGRSTDTHKDMKPITEKVRQVDVFGGFTAAAGHNFYTARAFPKAYWNEIAFVSEPTGHIVHMNRMKKSGTDYEDNEPTTGQGFNLMAGADEWFAPVFAEVGPDGAVWVADWYSYIIQHNPVPQGFSNGSGNAYETPLRDFTHGRIYRVGYNKAPVHPVATLNANDPAGLVAALSNTNQFWRMKAQRLLVERGNKDVVPQLWAIANNPSVDEIGINAPAIHALWTLHGLNAISPSDLEKALQHPSGHVRKTAVQVMPRTNAGVTMLLARNALTDGEPLVVMQTLLAISESPASRQADDAVLARLRQTTSNNDRWLPDAYACVLNRNGAALLKQWMKEVQAAAPPVKGSTGQNAMPHDHHMMNAGAAPTGGPLAPTTAPASTVDGVDLVVDRVTMEPVSPLVYERTRTMIYVKNQGSVAIPKGTVIPLSMRFEAKDGETNKQKVDYVSTSFADGLAPGETAAIGKVNNGPWVGDLWLTGDRPGDYVLTISIDKDNKLAESNRNNNIFRAPLKVKAPAQLRTVMLERAARMYASTASPDSIALMLKQATMLGPDDAVAMVKGLAEGYNYPRRLKASAETGKLLASISENVPAESRPRLNRLLEAWGLRDANADQDPNAQVVRIKTVREEMRFDQTAFTVKAGKPVVIVLENPDAMQHNLVVGKPKSMERIGKLADAMITAKDGAERNYVPTTPDIIAATALVNPAQTVRLTFTAPEQPGEYPYICTFPGHWRLMKGMMKVVKDDPKPAAK